MVIFLSRPEKYGVDRLRHVYGSLLQNIGGDDDFEARSKERAPSNNSMGNLLVRLKLAAVAALSESGPEVDEEDKALQKNRELTGAFVAIQATRTVRGSASATIALRDSESAASLGQARIIEKHVIKLIARIGEIVINSTRTCDSSKNNEAFAYFCEKNILGLFVEIVRARPDESNTAFEASSCKGVTWSPLVKAQVLHTVASLISSVRDASTLFYLLSQNCLNELITCMLPLHQWTDPALETMLHVYATLLKHLGLHLSSSPRSMYPLFIEDQSFPLFHATLETAISNFTTTSDKAVHLTCLGIIVDLLQIQVPSFREWIVDARQEQQHLALHTCELVVKRFQKLVQLTTGPVVDGVRANAVAGQLQGLSEELDLISDIFLCGIKSLNVRLCELLLQKVIRMLLTSLLPDTRNDRHFLLVGFNDSDVVPEQEAGAQVATAVIHILMERISYAPLVRMLAVAIWHPTSTKLWGVDAATSDFALTKSLHCIASSQNLDTHENDEESESMEIENPYRNVLLAALQGDHGVWRVPAVAALAKQTMSALDSDTLASLDIIPSGDLSLTLDEASVFERSIHCFLMVDHSEPSSVTSAAIESICLLAVELIETLANGASLSDAAYCSSLVWTTLNDTRDMFYRRIWDSRSSFGVADLFVDLVESAVEARYRKHSNFQVEGTIRSEYGFTMTERPTLDRAQRMVRRMRDTSSNEVEQVRFYIQESIYFRALCRCMSRFQKCIGHIPEDSAVQQTLSMDLLDPADELCNIFGSLKQKPMLGADIDLRGRTTFRFTLGHEASALLKARNNEPSELVMVLDAADIFVARPLTADNVSRGHVITSIPLLSIIATAGDGAWLHIAVRQPNVEHLIKNGNMKLCFDSEGTCLIIIQYLDRSRQILRHQLLEHIQTLFPIEKKDNDDP